MIRRRVLAKQLRMLREQSGLTLEQAAPKLVCELSAACGRRRLQPVAHKPRCWHIDFSCCASAEVGVRAP